MSFLESAPQIYPKTVLILEAPNCVLTSVIKASTKPQNWEFADAALLKIFAQDTLFLKGTVVTNEVKKYSTIVKQLQIKLTKSKGALTLEATRFSFYDATFVHFVVFLPSNAYAHWRRLQNAIIGFL